MQNEITRWALVFDGYTNYGGKRLDALIVQIGGPEQDLPARIVQNYKPASLLRRCKVVGNPVFLDQTSMIAEGTDYKEWLLEGIREHPKVSSLWARWVHP